MVLTLMKIDYMNFNSTLRFLVSSTLLYLIFLIGISSCEFEPIDHSAGIINDSTLIADQVQLADRLADSNPDSARHIYQNTLDLTNQGIKTIDKNTEYHTWLLKHNALSHRGLGILYTNEGDLQKALNELNNALQIVEQYETSNPSEFAKDVISILNSKGVVQKKFGQYTEALETYQKAVGYAEKINDLNSVAIFLTNTGNIYQELGELDLALEYIEKAIDQHKILNNERGVAISSLTLANILNSQAKFAEARPHYIQALNFCKEQGYSGHVGLIQSNLGVLEKRLGNLNLAQDYFNNAIENIEKAGNKQGLALVYGNLADLAITQNDYKNAIEYANKQLNEAKETQALVNQRYAYKHLSKAFAGLNNYERAYSNHLLYNQIHDSIASIEKRNEIARLEAVYQDEKKKEEIAYLANLSTALTKENRVKNFLIISITLLLFLAILLAATWIHNSKLKSKQQQLILEHKLLRSQMNPHFLFNSLSAIQNMVIRADKMEAAGLVASFSRFIRFILDSSMSNLIPLDKEIEAINLYLDLQKVRFPNLFTFNINIDINESTSEVLVPPLIIQPFVENSVIHGFPKNLSDGKLNVTIFQDNGHLCCRVKDNGIGFKNSVEKKEGAHKSVATQIARERLDILSKRYKCNASIVHEKLKESEKGTSILITLPFIFFDEESTAK